MADRIASQPGPSTPPSTVDARTIVNESEGDRTRDVLALERSVMAGGSPYHIGTDGEAGTLEKRMTVDFGDGPEEVIMVEWLPDDPECPFNWSRSRKVVTVFCTCFFAAITCFNATSVGVIATWAIPWFHTDQVGFMLSLLVYLMAVAWTPLILAPLSELFGRNQIYIYVGGLFAILFIPQALTRNYSAILATRWFQGMAASVANSMVGGTIADIYRAESRGVGMSVFSLAIFAGQSLGSVIFAWVGQILGMKWVYGMQAIFSGLSLALNLALLKETRGSVLLQRRAKRLTKKTGVKHLCASQLEKKTLLEMVKGSAIRPLQYLFTEPIVSAISLWIGFAWGAIFLGTSSTLLVFAQYTDNVGLQGTAEITMLVGALLGFLSNFHMESIYRRAGAKSPTGRAAPEVRLYWAASGGLLFPLSLFVYGWTGRPEIHWIVPAIFLSLSNWGIFVMYSGVFNYLADAYEMYRSSAQASQSFTRNIFSSTLPLCAHKMYTSMGYAKASTMVGAIGLVLAIAPFAIIKYGPKLRARSKVARAIASGKIQ